MSLVFRIIFVYLITITERNCGKHPQNYRKVFYGKSTDISQYPFIVALIIKSLDRNDGQFTKETQFCAGSIISHKWVITTAFCIMKHIVKYEIDPMDWFVRCGTSDWKATRVSQKYMKDYPVADFFVHEKSRSSGSLYFQAFNLLPPELPGFDYDVGLIQVQPKFVFNEAISYIKLAGPNFKYITGFRCDVLGYGKTETSATNSRLHIANLKIENYTACKEAYRKSGYAVTERMFCAGFLEGGPNSCERDTGGPLIHNVGRMSVLIGISSFGKGCGTRGYPAFYTKISEFQEWILKFETATKFSDN